MNNNLKGNIFQDNAFSSTSLDQNKASGFSGIVSPVEFEIQVPKGSRGLHLGDLSSRPYEKEFLLPRNTKFNIVDVIKSGDDITDAWKVIVEVLK